MCSGQAGRCPETDAAVQLRLVPRIGLPKDDEQAAQPVDNPAYLIFVGTLRRCRAVAQGGHCIRADGGCLADPAGDEGWVTAGIKSGPVALDLSVAVRNGLLSCSAMLLALWAASWAR